MSAPYRPDFVETIPDPIEATGARVHGRCPHCHVDVVVVAPLTSSTCRSCQRAFALLEILPLTRIAV